MQYPWMETDEHISGNGIDNIPFSDLEPAVKKFQLGKFGNHGQAKRKAEWILRLSKRP